MADTDCIDWQIKERIVEQLRTCTNVNGFNTDVKTVELVRAELSFDKEYPAIIVIPKEPEFIEEYLRRDDVLEFVVIYSDGQLETKESVSYQERYKNVGADIIKCIKMNPTLGGICQYIEIPVNECTVLEDEKFREEIVYAYVNVHRTIDSEDPYKLA